MHIYLGTVSTIGSTGLARKRTTGFRGSLGITSGYVESFGTTPSKRYNLGAPLVIAGSDSNLKLRGAF